MDKKFKECMKPHALMHSLTGFGVGLIVAAAIPAIGAQGVILGLIALVAGIVGDYAVNKG